MIDTNIPLNPRDENQTPLPHGNKALFITLGVFFVMIITTVILLNFATEDEPQYSNLESEAADIFRIFSIDSSQNRQVSTTVVDDTNMVPVQKSISNKQKSILERMSELDLRLNTLLEKDENFPAYPDVDLKDDF